MAKKCFFLMADSSMWDSCNSARISLPKRICFLYLIPRAPSGRYLCCK